MDGYTLTMYFIELIWTNQSINLGNHILLIEEVSREQL